MARCPFAVWTPAGATPGGAILPRTVIVHSEATRGDARPHSGLEWHFWVARDGRIKQVVDTERRADANNRANAFAVSIETEDDGDPDREPWSDAQLWALERLIRWVCTTHRIPLRRCPSWQQGGIGYHTMWGAPSPWTPVAKTCPGRVRIRQFDEVLMPRLLGTVPPDDQEVDDMFRDVEAMLTLYYDFPSDPRSWDKEQRTACAWWFDIAAEHGIGNAGKLMANDARKFGRIG